MGSKLRGDEALTRVDGRELLRGFGTAGTDTGFPHVCAGTECAICEWLTEHPYPSRGGESVYEREAKTLDVGKGIAENKATRTSVDALNRA
jgi:hypothetical protein